MDCTSCGDETMVEMLRRRAAATPDRRAFSYRNPGDEPWAEVTYGELDRHARQIAAQLQATQPPGSRALLLYPPGLEYISAFFGCLYAGVIAVPVYLPRAKRPMPRLVSILENASPSIVLASSSVAAKRDADFVRVPAALELPWLTTDECSRGEEAWHAPAITGQSLAFLQYTSGSTAVPKGVMISHANLLHNLRLIAGAFETSPESRGVFWLPLYHDMGLIGGVLQTLYCGGSSVLLSPLSLLQNPLQWLQTISQTRATISGGPDFAYDLCVQKIGEAARVELDLSCWETAFTGAEPIRSETMERFAEAFGPCGFRYEAFFPCYGLAEATLMVSAVEKQVPPVVTIIRGSALAEGRIETPSPGDADLRQIVGCGQKLAGHEIAIVDPQTLCRSAENTVGEIWVAGPSVAQGYFGAAELSRETFQAALDGQGRFLRTGDLGFLSQDQLFVTGRLKDLIIIRGRNHYPQDVEATAQASYPGLRSGGGAAFSLEVDEQERLIIVQEVERRAADFSADVAMDAIRQAVLAEHEVEVYAVVLLRFASIPKTSSGKIQRHACREAFVAGTLDEVARWVLPTPLAQQSHADSNGHVNGHVPRELPSEQEIRAWLGERLGAYLHMPAATIDPQEAFVTFGLSSVQAVQITNELEHWLGRHISPTSVYNYPNIALLSTFLASGGGVDVEVAVDAAGNGAAHSNGNGHHVGNGVDHVNGNGHAAGNGVLREAALREHVAALTEAEIEMLLAEEMQKQN